MNKQNQKKYYTMQGVKWWDKQLIKKILAVGLPLMLTNIFFSLTEITDNISLSIWAPQNAIAVAHYASRLYWISFLFLLMFPSMFGFLVSQYYGAKQYQKEKQTVANTTLFSLISSIISLIVIFISGKEILSLFIKKDELYNHYLEKSYQYVKVFACLMILEATIQGLTVGIIAEGKTKQATMISALSIPFNLFFNFLFMNIMDMKTLGCAYSTLTSWAIVFIFLIIWIVIKNYKNEIHFGFNPLQMFKFDKKIIWKGLKRCGIGLTTILTEISIILTMTVFSRNFSDGVIVISIINPFFNFVMFVGAGIVATKSHFVGTKLGNGKFKLAYEIDCKMNLYAFVFGVINGLMVAVLAYPLPLIYVKQTTYHKLLAMYALLAIAVSYPFVVLANSLIGSLIVGGKGNQTFMAWSIQPFVLEVGLLWVLAVTTNISFILLYIIYRVFKSSKIIIAYIFWNHKKWITNETGIKEFEQQISF